MLIGKGAHSPLVLSGRHRQAAHAVARPAEDRPCRHLLHASRQSGRAGRRVRRCDGCRGQGRPHPRAYSAAPTGRASGMDAAIAYAEKNAKRTPGALSNNFSLGRDDRPDLGRLRRRLGRRMEGLAEARVSSRISPGRARARGFFTDRAGRDKYGQRRDRARPGTRRTISAAATAPIELAARLGLAPIHVALAYVLDQPLPVVR